MTTLTSRDPKELAAEHLTVLRKLAERVLLRDQALDESEQMDVRSRMTELFAIGGSFKLTECELVLLLYKGLFVPPRCGCPSCRARRGNRG